MRERIAKWLAAHPWVAGLLAAIEGALTGFVTQLVMDPSAFNLHDWRHFVGAVAGAVIQAVRQYLRQSPLPRQPWTLEERSAKAARAAAAAAGSEGGQ